MSLRVLPKSLQLSGKRVFLRVDWNIPLGTRIDAESAMKIERSKQTIDELVKRGAIVIACTHLGRPKGKEEGLSTKHLLSPLKRLLGHAFHYHETPLTNGVRRKQLAKQLASSAPGTLHLLENIRFYKGEELNDRAFAKSLSELADVYVNDAFAACHRKHASVVGITKFLPSYAGLVLTQEVQALQVLHAPRHPYMAIIGGKKLSTKLPLIKTLLETCDAVFIGGALAHSLFEATGRSIGASYTESDVPRGLKALAKHERLRLPIDVVVTNGSAIRVCKTDDIGDSESVIDIGPASTRAWMQELRSAKTIVWNGPLGHVEHAQGTLATHACAQFLAHLPSQAYVTVCGGGDTIPVLAKTHTLEQFTAVSTGGGAMLEYIMAGDALPGLAVLRQERHNRSI